MNSLLFTYIIVDFHYVHLFLKDERIDKSVANHQHFHVCSILTGLLSFMVSSKSCSFLYSEVRLIHMEICIEKSTHFYITVMWTNGAVSLSSTYMTW